MNNLKSATNLFIQAQQEARLSATQMAAGELNGNKFVLVLGEQGWQADVTLRNGFQTVVCATQIARAVRLIAS